MGLTGKQRRGGIELRAAEQAEGGKMMIEGKAISFNSPTLLWRDENGLEYYEQIDANALEGADMTDTCLRYNHTNTVPVLARIRGGSLVTEKRSDGLYEYIKGKGDRLDAMMEEQMVNGLPEDGAWELAKQEIYYDRM